MRRVSIIGVAALSAIVLLAGCGGSGGSSNASTTPVAAVSAPSLSAEQIMTKADKAMTGLSSASFRADVAVKMTGSGSSSNAQAQALTQSPISIHAEGKAEGKSKVKALEASMTVRAGGQDLAMGAKVDGKKTWLQFQNQWYVVPPSKTKSVRSAGSGGVDKQLGALGIDPKAWLAGTTVSTEQLDGATVYHVVAKADTKRVMDDMMKAMNDPSLLKAAGSDAATLSQLKNQNQAALKSLQNSLVSAKAEYWVDAQTFYIRKGSVDADMKFSGDISKQGLSAATLAVTYTLGDFDQPVTVTPPASAKPFSQLMKGLFNMAPTTGLGTGTGL